jgi:PAS domain S-box-containing protein
MSDEPGARGPELERERRRRRQAEEALRQAEERHRLLIECVKDYAIYTMDTDGRITLWNEGAHRLLGYTAEEALGQHTAITFTEEERRAGKPERELRGAAASGSASDDNWVVRKDGSRFCASGFTNALRDEAGRLRGFVKIFRDLSERRRMEEDLRQARDELERRVGERTAELTRAQERAVQAERLAAIGQTVAGLAHEGRNALQAIHACCERLAWRLQGRPEALALVAEVEKAEEALQRLFDDVRNYAAPVHLDRRPCDLGQVWGQAWAEAVARHPGRDARLEEQTGGLSLACDADPFRLAQVFRNAFDNSLAAAAGPPHVTVSCAEATLAGAPALRVAVRDNGSGLSPEQRRNIFEPFYTTKTRGTGLGMAIAKRIVDAHGGEIGVGEGAGPGAEIVILLPRGAP